MLSLQNAGKRFGSRILFLEADWLIRKARALLVPAEEGVGFEKHYFNALQRDPDVVIAHGRMTKVFARIS